MAASDGLIKNETISIVRQRYFIKVDGKNAPMNIAPNFKLGMNVKEMTHFSTTKDAVVFPKSMEKVVRTKEIQGQQGLLLEDVLITSGMIWEEDIALNVVSIDGSEILLDLKELSNYYITYKDKNVYLFHKDTQLMKNVLRIEKR